MDKTLLQIVNELGSKVKRKILGVVLLLPMLIILLTSAYLYYQITSNKENFTQTIESLQKSQADILTATVSESHKRAELQTKLVKNDIIARLHETYNDDLDRMKADYESLNNSTPFYQILSDSINSEGLSSNERIFIANRNGILIDNSLDHYSNSFVTWENYFDSSIHKQFLEQALQNISIQRGDVILWVEDETDFDSIKFFETNGIVPVEEFFHLMCTNNKIDQLSHYSILSVSYIFDHSDVFGVPDVDAGNFTNNDKLFIIYVSNIGDIITNTHHLHTTLSYYSNIIKVKSEYGKHSIAYDTLLMILIVFLELVTFIGTWYLVEFYLTNRELVLYQERNHQND